MPEERSSLRERRVSEQSERTMHKITGKAKIGPGGVKCQCCIPTSRKEFKKLTNKYLRRDGKRNLEKE